MERSRPSAFLKMDRAVQHFGEVAQGSLQFLQSNPPLHVTEPQSNGSLGLRLHVTKQAPVSLALAMGDCVHNLRSALDHLVWSLVQANGCQPTKKNQFPIGNAGGADYNRWAPTALAGVHPDALSTIDSMEPWRGGRDHGAWLYRLHRLDIADKHKLTLPVSALVVANIRVKTIEGHELTLPLARRTFTDGDLVYDGSSGDYSGAQFTSSLVMGDPDDPDAPAILESQALLMHFVTAVESTIQSVRSFL